MRDDETAGVVLRAPRYVLGEILMDHTQIEGFADFVDRRRMVPDARLWGWGTVHRTALGTAALAVRTGRRTLRAAAVEPGEVDALVLCSTTFPAEDTAHGGLVGSILRGLDLEVPVTGITLNRCANLLTGLRAAAAMVASGGHRTVLVITADRVAAESGRITDFALFSDGAASCLVTRAPGGVSAETYAWVADAYAQDPAALGRGDEISADLARSANRRLSAEAGVGVEAIDGLLHNNVFLPIVTMKEVQAGFKQSQLYTANIGRVGHCFAADPLINLVDRQSAGSIRAGGLYLLASSVSGLRVCVLLGAGSA